MRYFFILFVASFFISCKSKEGKKEEKLKVGTVVSITTDSIPPEFSIIGTPTHAWSWKDGSGDNFLIYSYEKDTSSEGQTSRLHAVHYVFSNADFSSLWGKSDTVLNCEFDITGEFIPEATTVTDIDEDGIAEVTIQYKQACRSDVSPAILKLVMHEGNDEYALQGLTFVKAAETDTFTVTQQNANLEKLPGYTGKEEEFLQTFGRYESEKLFATAPAGFLEHARRQWMRYVKEFTE